LALSFVLVVCLAGVFCLAPLSVYLLWLALLNRRSRPAVVAGTWDFAALLLGLSGFLLYGGGLLLSLLQSNVRFWMRGNFEALRDAWGQEKVAWSLIVGAYLLLVVGGAALTLLSRRRTLVVYNVEPGPFETTLAEVFEQIGRPAERRGNLWVAGVPVCEAEPFAGGRTVTLRWVADDPRLFQEVERNLRAAVGGIPSADGQTARWLMSSAVGTAVVAIACTILLVFYVLALVR
jgi:hypothetical protein